MVWWCRLVFFSQSVYIWTPVSSTKWSILLFFRNSLPHRISLLSQMVYPTTPSPNNVPVLIISPFTFISYILSTCVSYYTSISTSYFLWFFLSLYFLPLVKAFCTPWSQHLCALIGILLLPRQEVKLLEMFKFFHVDFCEFTQSFFFFFKKIQTLLTSVQLHDEKRYVFQFCMA